MDAQAAISRIVFRAGLLLSLMDMLRFYAGPFNQSVKTLHSLRAWAERTRDERGRDYKLSGSELTDLRDKLNQIDRQYEKIRLKRALEALADLRNMFLKLDIKTLKGDTDLTAERLLWHLDRVSNDASKDLFESYFVYVPKHLRDYCDNPELFGKPVLKIFPDARDDIVEAGNCYAVGAHTASVFHLMRVLEHGLRALAADMKVKFKKNPKDPIEFRQWGEIIGAMETRIGQIEKTKKTRARDLKLEFYRGAQSHFKYFKDAWRNHVMHSRSSYDEYDTPKLLDHVGSFMQHLSSHRRVK
jgi:hypothetical protein